jgi:predicted Zn-dependent protease
MIVSVLARLLLAAGAVAAALWLAVSLTATRAEAGGLALAFGDPALVGRAEAERGLELAERANRLNPGTDPELLRAVLLRRAGRPDEAVAQLKDVVASEPANVRAWAVLAVYAEEGEPRLSRSARRRVRRLSPRATPAQGLAR